MSEELVVRHCAPTLAGMKTGSMFNCSYASAAEMGESLRQFNGRLGSKGLRFLPLRYKDNLALIYVYRPSHLRADLGQDRACSLLEAQGYCPDSPGQCLARLMGRLKQDELFPHEIGLFLGYPPEDVCGFIENKAQNCKCVGCWKVYGDEDKAQKTFAKYKKCTDIYRALLEQGTPLEKLTVAG